ncbi:MAG: GGDEF domain-containing protein [Anaeroplasmataceae bacterium]
MMELNKKKIQLNRKDINERNYRILLVTLIAILIIYICSIPVSLIVTEYKVMFVPYLIVIGVLSIILGFIFLFKKVFKKYILFFSYFLFTAFYLYLAFSSIVLQPDMVCVTILFFLFLNPIIILDYEWRIDTFTAMNSIIYMVLVLVFKNNDTKVHEIFNVLSTLSLCLFLSHFSNKIMLDNIDLKRLAEESAKTDYLTGLRNRIELFEVLKTDKNITSVIMLDIDFFKTYNDTYSHQMGDDCLIAVSNVLLDISNTYKDVNFYRYGGEEFIGIVKNIFDESIYNIAEDIRKKVYDLNIEHIKSNHNKVTVSVGFTIVMDQDAFDYNIALSQADKALYKAKDNGRNRVERYIEE